MQHTIVSFSPTITRDNGVTVAEITASILSGGFPLYMGTGSARTCDPDTPDDVVGAQLALGRALKKLGTQFIKAGYSEVHKRDEERRIRHEASQKSVAAAKAAGIDFQERFAALIEELHPGTFRPTVVSSTNRHSNSRVEFVRENLPA